MSIIKTAMVLFITAVITTALLGVAYTLTLEPIAEQVKRTQEAAMKEVFPEADSFDEIATEVPGSMSRVFSGSKGGQMIGYVVELAPKGYNGSINMLVGISSEDNVITGMRVLKHSETPGLGALAVKESFYRQYDNKKLVPLKVVRSSSKEDEINAITSSTITTKAITDAVNEAIEWYNGGGVR